MTHAYFDMFVEKIDELNRSAFINEALDDAAISHTDIQLISCDYKSSTYSHIFSLAMATVVSTSSLKPAQQVLIKRCVAVRESAYCPYSKFKVGAAVESVDHVVHTGTNVENAAYSPSICAERIAMGSAVAAGRRQFTRIAVAAEVADSLEFVTPCGLCRQFIAEFGECEIILVRPSDMERVMITTLDHLLPMRFGQPKDDGLKK